MKRSFYARLRPWMKISTGCLALAALLLGRLTSWPAILVIGGAGVLASIAGIQELRRGGRQKQGNTAMKHLTKRQRWLALGGGVLIAVLVLCAWLFGWGRGNINMIPYSAGQIDRIELTSTDVSLGLYRSVVTDKEDIQALINSANSFRHTGSELKDVFRYGPFTGGATLYEFDIFPSDGEPLLLIFSSNNGGQPWSDIELSYWIYGEKTSLFGNTCRGSLETFCEMYEAYCVQVFD